MLQVDAIWTPRLIRFSKCTQCSYTVTHKLKQTAPPSSFPPPALPLGAQISYLNSLSSLFCVNLPRHHPSGLKPPCTKTSASPLWIGDLAFLLQASYVCPMNATDSPVSSLMTSADIILDLQTLRTVQSTCSWMSATYGTSCRHSRWTEGHCRQLVSGNCDNDAVLDLARPLGCVIPSLALPPTRRIPGTPCCQSVQVLDGVRRTSWGRP